MVKALCLLPFLVVSFAPAQSAHAAVGPRSASAPPSISAAMEAAASSRQVPFQVVAATAYVNTRWEWITSPQHDGGVGPMKVRPAQLGLASSLSGHSPAQITGELASNIDAGAALMAYYHTQAGGLASWQPAVAATQGPMVAAEVFTVIRNGASRTTSAGETITLTPQATPQGATSVNGSSTASASCTPSPDYGAACWIPADASNYSTANRTHDYPIDMIIIHDIEGDASTGIQDFQTLNWGASAHYVVGYDGAVTEMVREHDIAWHAGNWDYNTRAIGIEHAGFAYTPGLYTTAEYNASAALAASICSRYGVPMDRTHVIGHYEVPDPYNPGQFGGSDHHTDPGPYWDWSYYMATAQNDAMTLPSPPHLMPDPVATDGLTSATVTWQPARTCRSADAPITGYTVVGQPGNLTMTVGATTTNATFSGLQPGTAYTFTVTAHNSYGDDSATSNAAIPGRCNNVNVSASPASPQAAGTMVTVGATSNGCPNPQYEFWIKGPGASSFTDVQPYGSSSTFTWSTGGQASGTYTINVWAKDASSPGTFSNAFGTWDAYNATSSYSLTPVPCTGVGESASPAGAAKAGVMVTVTATAVGCPGPQYEFWILAPGAALYTLAQGYSNSPSLSWSTSGLAPGTYRVNVWVRDASSMGLNSNASGSYDAYDADLYYTLSVGCPSASVSATPADGAMVGTNVSLTASAPGCPNPQFEYWALYPGASLYTLVQAYTTSATLMWPTAQLPIGTYRLNVWVRDGSGPGVYGNASGTYDAYDASLYYPLTSGCPSVSLTGSPPGGSMIGGIATFTARSPGCANPQYEYWVLYPGASLYTLVRQYGSSGTLSWPTSQLAPGTYRVNVWVRNGSGPGAYSNSSGSWDAYDASLYYEVTNGCPSVSQSASTTATSVGTQLTITADAPGCPNPQFEFWILYPGASAYTLVRPYGPSGTLTWSTSTLSRGTYRINVWVRDASSAGTFSNPWGSWDAYDASLYISLN